MEIKKASPEEQYLIRKLIVRLNGQGKNTSEIVEILGVKKRHVQSIVKRYKELGEEGIALKRRGRQKGEKRILTPEQEQEIQDKIKEHTPNELGYELCLWDRDCIADFICREYGIKLKLSTLGYYLERWGFSVQKPQKRAASQDEAKIDDWLNNQFPEITKQAEQEDAEVFFADETGIQNNPNCARGYAPIGKTPTVKVESKQIKINMISAVSKSGKLRFMLYESNMNADLMIDFMRRLIRDASKKVFLIVDNLRVHHAKKVTAWVEKHKHQIELFFLPPYAPEYNPDELLNAHLKKGIGSKAAVKTVKDVSRRARSHMMKLQRLPDVVCGFFGSVTTAYAA